MATNKKKVKKSANGEASAKAAAVSSGSGSGSGAASRAAAAATNATSGPSVPTLSNVKFTMLILLGVGVKFAMDYASAVSAGTESKDCAAYIQNVTECSATDVAMIRLKYHSTLTTIAMVAMTAWNVRANEPLLLRLLSALLFAPLLFTVMALQATRAWMDPMKNFWIGINVTVLFIVVMKAFGNAPVLAPFVRSVDLSTMTVLTLLTARVYDITKFLQEETEGYVVVQTLPVTAPAKALLYFLVVDKATVVVLLVFALAFLNYDNRRYFLFCFSLANVVAGLYFLPKSADVLVDRPYQDQFFFGGAFFSMVTAIGPKITFFGADDDDDTTTTGSPVEPAAPGGESGDKKED